MMLSKHKVVFERSTLSTLGIIHYYKTKYSKDQGAGHAEETLLFLLYYAYANGINVKRSSESGGRAHLL